MIEKFVNIWQGKDDFECADCNTTNGKKEAISELSRTEYGYEGVADYCIDCAKKRFEVGLMNSEWAY